MSRRSVPAVLAAASVLAVAHTASATTYGAGDILSNFALVSATTITQNAGHFAFPVVAGGNVTVANPSNTQIPSQTLFPGFAQANSYGGAITVMNDSGATKNTNPPGTIASFTTPLQNLSTALATLTPSTTITADPNPNNFILSPTSLTTIDGTTVGVVNVSESLLANAASVYVNPNGAGLVVINVTGTGAFSSNFNFQLLNGQTAASVAGSTLFNFVGATSVNLGTLDGTVLAPDSPVTNVSGNFTGEIAAQKITLDATFAADLLPTSDDAFLNAKSVPEPASLALLAMGLLPLGLVRRRL